MSTLFVLPYGRCPAHLTMESEFSATQWSDASRIAPTPAYYGPGCNIPPSAGGVGEEEGTAYCVLTSTEADLTMAAYDGCSYERTSLMKWAHCYKSWMHSQSGTNLFILRVCAYCDWLLRTQMGLGYDAAGSFRDIASLEITGAFSQNALAFATELDELFPMLQELTLRCLRWTPVKEVDCVAQTAAAAQKSLAVKPCTYALKQLIVYNADAQDSRQCALVLRWILCGTAQGTLATLTVDSTTLAALLHASAPAQSEPEVDRKHTKNARARPSTFALTQRSQCSVEVRVVPGVDRVAADHEFADVFVMLR
ncbi:hypothetical protein C8Q77DRAFT_184894 [Trametes polyzona]|nr:hypothetical protein C8Q77DRAFT_184894 [Trametes polyzona]